MNQYKCLLVIIPDRLSDLMNKGEITERYYNPGDLFEEIHLVLTNDDVPIKTNIQKMVGNAKLTIHNIPTGSRFFIKTLAGRTWLVKNWARQVVKLASEVKPQLVRCYGANYNAFAAHEIFVHLKIPYVVSIHTMDDRKPGESIISKIQTFFLAGIERKALQSAVKVLPVYESIVPRLERMHLDNFEVVYNVINSSNILPKENFITSQPIKILTVGRQIKGKNPANIIRALVGIPEACLTVIGNGPLHSELIELAYKYGVSNRVEFRASMPNEELCSMLQSFDIFTIHSDYWELPKTIIEAFLAGLPVVVNKLEEGRVPELTDDICLLTENSPKGYQNAIRYLLDNKDIRESLGKKAARNAWSNWDATKTEAKYVQIYENALA